MPLDRAEAGPDERKERIIILVTWKARSQAERAGAPCLSPHSWCRGGDSDKSHCLHSTHSAQAMLCMAYGDREDYYPFGK